MSRRLDHVVLWVRDPRAAVRFYSDVVGLTPVRDAEFAAGRAPFPSVRVCADTILDLMDRAAAPAVADMTGSPGSAGHPVNHLCLAVEASDFDLICRRLDEHGVTVTATMEDSFGARGLAPRSMYFRDPDGNVVEIRHYPDDAAPPLPSAGVD